MESSSSDDSAPLRCNEKNEVEGDDEEEAVSMSKPKKEKGNTQKKLNRSKKQAKTNLISTTTGPVRVSSRQARAENALMNTVLTRIYKHEASIYFMRPVDPVELEIPDYFDIIDKPMDLGTIKQKLSDLAYESAPIGESYEAFGIDMRLVFCNAYTYNHMEDNPVHIAGKELEAVFDKEYTRMVNTIVKQREEEEEATARAAVGTARTSVSTNSKKHHKGRFTEAESDDEFAMENFTYSDDDTTNKKKGRPSKSLKHSKSSKKNSPQEEDDEVTFGSDGAESEDNTSDNDSDEGSDDDGFEYRVQHVLASKTMTPTEWRNVCDHMNTKEITRGSAWKQPDEEYYDDSA